MKQKVRIDVVNDFVRELSKGHAEFLRDANAKLGPNEFIIDDKWQLVMSREADAIIITAVCDFQKYLETCMGVKMPIKRVKDMGRFF